MPFVIFTSLEGFVDKDFRKQTSLFPPLIYPLSLFPVNENPIGYRNYSSFTN